MAQHGVDTSLVADRYASALFELSAEQGAVATVSEALRGFKKLIDESPEFRTLIASPVFSAAEQTKALTKTLQSAGVAGLAANFLRLVATKRRLHALPAIIDAFQRKEDEANGVTRAEAVVAKPLSEAEEAALKQALMTASGGKTVNLDVKTDPSIIGGVIVKLGSRMVDASIRTKLNSIRTRMKEVG
ncbi:MAG TPA: F0F1 ATP synthase subunit delta [Methylocystis sp.]|nr:F0F1 ATP synthase subunit delta [Methylocystis sp.]